MDVDVAKEEISEITHAYGLSYYFSAVVTDSATTVDAVVETIAVLSFFYFFSAVVMDVIPSEITEDVAAANS